MAPVAPGCVYAAVLAGRGGTIWLIDRACVQVVAVPFSFKDFDGNGVGVCDKGCTVEFSVSTWHFQ